MVTLTDELKNTKSVLSWLICLTYMGLFLPIRASNATLFVLLAYCLIETNPREYIVSLRRNASSLLLATYYLLFVVGMLYTSNFDAGIFVLERKLSLLLLPLFLIPLLQKLQLPDKTLFRRIGYITLLSSALMLIVATVRRFLLDDMNSFYFEQFTYPNYVYFSMYFAVGSLLLIDSLFEDLPDPKYGVVILVSLFAYCLIMIVLIASKAGIITFCVCAVFLLYRRVKQKRIVAMSLLAFFLGGSVLLGLNQTTRDRFTGLTDGLRAVFEPTLPNDLVLTNVSVRVLFWRIAITHAVEDRVFMTGVGTGDAQDYLNSLYASPRYNLHGFVNWESHNQWVFTFIQLGLAGVVALAAVYIRCFVQAFRGNNLKLLVFLAVTLGFTMSESILESNKGIVFFALLFTLLSITPLPEKEEVVSADVR